MASLPVLSAAAVLVLGLAAAPAAAGEVTGSLAVRVVVQGACALTGGTLDFGAYTSGQPGDLLAKADLGYFGCAEGELTFGLDGGLNGDTALRRLSDGAGNFLSYTLFRDGARGAVFGGAEAGQSLTIPAAGAGSVSVYGRITGGQHAPPGTYTDLVTVTLTF